MTLRLVYSRPAAAPGSPRKLELVPDRTILAGDNFDVIDAALAVIDANMAELDDWIRRAGLIPPDDAA
jgi:hypothetical protein